MSQRPPPESPGRPPTADAAPSRDGAAAPDRVLRTCPVCGRELAERRCKLYCPEPRCGYFLSCADYY